MNGSRHFALVILALGSFVCHSAEDEVYRHFLSLSTNLQTVDAITSPLLVDTNNTHSKLAGAIFNLQKLKLQDGLAGIRLGMSVDQVVASWGKPIKCWANFPIGNPAFFYADTELGFETNSLKVIWILVGDGTRFENRLSTRSSIEDWVRALGKPTMRRGQVADFGLLFYRETKATMIVDFSDGVMTKFRLEKPEPHPRWLYEE